MWIRTTNQLTSKQEPLPMLPPSPLQQAPLPMLPPSPLQQLASKQEPLPMLPPSPLQQLASKQAPLPMLPPSPLPLTTRVRSRKFVAGLQHHLDLSVFIPKGFENQQVQNEMRKRMKRRLRVLAAQTPKI
jgi:hypothetical protein